MDEIEDRQPRIGVSAAAALLATAVLSMAISYNALWRQTASGSAPLAGIPALDPGALGSTRVVVDLDQPQPTTITLRYDPTIEAVQRELAASGLYSGPIDGVAGRRTQLAIRTYQRMHQLDQTGSASAALVDHIQLTRQFAAAADTTASLPPGASAGTIKSVQLRLQALGYDPGSIDGQLGGQTQVAIRRFQQDRGIAATGGLSEELIVELNKSGFGADHATP
jgi:peptidoglycan hydrolase-like protein with peptidoglycan-binding domain